MRSLGKSDYAGLVKYVTDTQEKSERLGQVIVTNCQAETLNAVIGEVLATQRMNTRSQNDKTYHLLVSFRAGEQPGAQILRAIEDHICNGLGFEGHQRISAVHHDTDNLHMHIAINKIHPDRLTIHEPYRAYWTLSGLCDDLEKKYGLESDNHERSRTVAEGRAADMEHHAGVESLVGWIKRGCLDDILNAQSWEELHKSLDLNGLSLRSRGNGFVIEARDGTTAKASTVSRDLSKPKLEERFGPFKPSSGSQATKSEYQKHPVNFRVDTSRLYAEFLAERKEFSGVRAAELEKIRDLKTHKIEAVNRSGRLRRAVIKLMGGNRTAKQLLYAQAFRALRTEIKAIQDQYRENRQGLTIKYPRLAWADWLKQKALSGNTGALAALRARAAAQGLKGNTVRGKNSGKEDLSPQPGQVDNITKKGTIIYRRGGCAVRDDGSRLQVSRKTTAEALKMALLLANERFGERLTVNGTNEFKDQVVQVAASARLPITFADPLLEAKRQKLVNKEQKIERIQRPKRNDNRGRVDRSGNGRSGSAIAGQHDGPADNRRTVGGNDGRDDGRRSLAESDIGSIGRFPPPQSRNGLRTLSQLGLVRIAGGSEMLLPGHVLGDMEQQRAQSNSPVRRGVSGWGLSSAQWTAADRYIAEREAKRGEGIDIPKHLHYDQERGKGPFNYMGTRDVDGQYLALLKQEDVIRVLPVDQATARRLKRVKVGDPVSVTSKGSIKTQGRSR